MATENYIELHILEHITNGFSERSKIGRGGYRDVYKGVYDGREVAVKLLHVDTLRGLDDQQFKNEVCNLLKVKHPNIVQLVGYCYQTKKLIVQHNDADHLSEHIYRVLCFEYLQGGSLDKCLYGKSFAPNWSTRYNIIKGICEGLNFLHDRENPILHLDLKPANILLDSSMVPKVADFGLSRLFNGSHTHVTERIAGAKRYMPPESTIEGMISVKNDVFSFGVVMIDIMIGSLGHSNSGEMDNFTQLTKLAFKNCSNLIEDKSLYREAELDQVNKCIGIATHCVHPERKSRPTMADILVTLNKTEIDIPKRRMKLKGHAGYDQETYLPFSPGLNVIAGDESSGKTSLLTAVQCALDTQCLRGANYHESDAGTAEEVSVEIGLDKDILGLLGHPTDQQQALTMSISRDADRDVKQYKLGASSELDINSDTIFRVQTLMTGSNAVIRFLQQGTIISLLNNHGTDLTRILDKLMVDRNAISQINSSIQNVQGYLDKCTNSFNREEQVLKLLKNTMVAERELKDLIRKLLDKAKEKVQLKTLDVEDTEITELPKEIGKLQQLKTLDVNHTKITKLPKEIGNLQHLETLRLKRTCVMNIPREIGGLKKLENLEAESDQNLVRLPLEICQVSKWVKLPDCIHQALKKGDLVSSLAGEILSIDQGEEEGALVVGAKHMHIPQWLKEHFNDLAALDIRICKLDEEDLKILREMPNLQGLCLRFEVVPREPISISGEGFTRLVGLIIDSRLPRVTFQEEAMPMLETLAFVFQLYSGPPNYDPMGIYHLKSLKRVVFQCNDWYHAESPCISAMIDVAREEAKGHPNRIILEVTRRKNEIFPENKNAQVSEQTNEASSSGTGEIQD